MFTLLISIVALVLGYIFYGRLVERIFNPDAKRTTPAYASNDGVDYIPMPTWKVFMIQFLNIAGTGPIFGAIMGAKFGPACYLWIVFGCIFGGAVHDYLSGMLSIRSNGKGLPGLVGDNLGNGAKNVMLVFTVVMLTLVGAVFVYSPAVILGDLVGSGDTTFVWVIVILLYYILATMVPIDKIIGKIYPLFAFALVFMAVSLLICLLVKWPANVPEIWDGIANRAPAAGTIFPCLFISIACGAVSGFHATQSPMMARCLKNENRGRQVFYGSMILEGLVALVWATISSYFFYGGGNLEMGALGVAAAPKVVTVVSRHWLGTLGSILAILGVVAAPITSGDTALRSCRLTIAESFHLDQGPIRNRLYICIPLFVVTGCLLWFNIADANGFDIIWRYFGWANQTLSIFTFWALTAYLSRNRAGLSYLITMIPGAFMTSVCTTFIMTAKIGFNLPATSIPYIACVVFFGSIALFYYLRNRRLSKAA